jgi:hypothetical protein
MAWVEQLRSCIDWDEEDRARLVEVRDLLNSRGEETVEDLGEQLAALNGTQALMTNARFTRRLRDVLTDWVMGLPNGAFDEEYVERRRALGQELADLDLMFEHIILLEGMTRQRVFELAQKRLDAQPQRLSSVMHTLDKALRRDLVFVYEGYLDFRDAEMEQSLLDRFLAITGFSPTLYDSLAEAWRWEQEQGDGPGRHGSLTAEAGIKS